VRSIFILSGILLLYTNILCAQEITKADILKFKIKTITTIEEDGSVKSVNQYNERGNIVMVYDKKDDELKLREDFNYNEKGSVIINRVYNTDGSVFQLTKYFYDSIERLVRSEQYNWKNSLDVVKTYEHDTSGNKIKEIRDSKTSGSTVTVFNYENNRLIEEEVINETIGKEEKSTYKYNKKGLLLEKKSRYYFGNTTIRLLYTYNSSGRLFQMEEKSNSGVSSLTTFQYSNAGLLLSERWQSDADKGGLKTTYIVEY
jgi:hypothetical protein